MSDTKKVIIDLDEYNNLLADNKRLTEYLESTDKVVYLVESYGTWKVKTIYYKDEAIKEATDAFIWYLKQMSIFQFLKWRKKQ